MTCELRALGALQALGLEPAARGVLPQPPPEALRFLRRRKWPGHESIRHPQRRLKAQSGMCSVSCCAISGPVYLALHAEVNLSDSEDVVCGMPGQCSHLLDSVDSREL